MKCRHEHYLSFFSYKQQLCNASNQGSDLTNQLQEMTELKDVETRRLKTELANSESAIQSLQQELKVATTQVGDC